MEQKITPEEFENLEKLILNTRPDRIVKGPKILRENDSYEISIGNFDIEVKRRCSMVVDGKINYMLSINESNFNGNVPSIFISDEDNFDISPIYEGLKEKYKKYYSSEDHLQRFKELLSS